MVQSSNFPIGSGGDFLGEAILRLTFFEGVYFTLARSLLLK